MHASLFIKIIYFLWWTGSFLVAFASLKFGFEILKVGLR